MTTVFVSYRRSDAPTHAGHLYDNLVARLGAGNVFMDRGSIEPGSDYVDVINAALKRSDAVLAVIGPRWLTDSRFRILDPVDWVRTEIVRAFERDVRVVPVLVDGGAMPAANRLPKELRPLARLQAVELLDAAWGAQVRSMVDSLQELAERAAASRVVPPPEVSRAIADYDRAVDTGDNRAIAKALYGLGDSWRRAGAYPEARKAYERALGKGDAAWTAAARVALDALDRASR